MSWFGFTLKAAARAGIESKREKERRESKKDNDFSEGLYINEYITVIRKLDALCKIGSSFSYRSIDFLIIANTQWVETHIPEGATISYMLHGGAMPYTHKRWVPTVKVLAHYKANGKLEKYTFSREEIEVILMQGKS